MNANDEIQLVELYAILMRSKWLIMSITAIVMLASLAASLVLPRSYKATVLVVPSEHTNSRGSFGALNSLTSAFGGLSTLAGITSPTANQAAIDVATLKSQVLINEFISANHLVPLLLSSGDGGARVNARLHAVNSVALWRATQKFKRKILDVSEDRKTGLIKISIIWKTPQTAALWANGLVEAVNSFLRNREISESQREVSYLKNQVKATSDLTIKTGIYALIQEQISRAMLAEGRQEYALRVIDPAFAPHVAYAPKPILWTLGGFLGGLLLSLGTALIRADLHKQI